MAPHRCVRIFLSSTFRDFGEERDLLVRQVFPALRARLKERFVELVDVDLRWGITVEQAERGEVLPICLTEIDRARPYFVGMLGERYGWVPPPEGYAADLLDQHRWLKEHQGGTSVTELEIRHGVLNNAQMAGRAFFYFRSRSYSKAQGGEYVAASAEDRERQDDLKTRIRASGYPVIAYRHPQALAKRLERDLWKLLNAEFPRRSIPDAFIREVWRHEAYATPRRRLYLGADRYLQALESALSQRRTRVLIEGASGSGKSALLANWLAQRRATQGDWIFEHYLAASADAADPQVLVRRLLESIKRGIGSSDEIPGDTQQMFDALPSWLEQASQHAQKTGKPLLIAIDALNGLTSQRDLRWFPAEIPVHVHVFVSCLPGEVLSALQRKGAWARIEVMPLDDADRRHLLREYLVRYNKVLPDALNDRVLRHPLSGNPLFLRTLAEELRLFGVHEQLEERLSHYLGSESVEALFSRVLARIEQDFPSISVPSVMTALWASRSGLREEEILGLCGLVQATWAPLRGALDEMLLAAVGLVTFAHDYFRQAVRARYLDTGPLRLQAHERLARWFAGQAPDARRAHEEPFQWLRSHSWEALRDCIVDPSMFRAVHRHSGQQALLRYWRALNGELGLSVASGYEAALQSSWQMLKPEPLLDALGRLQRFLAFCGCTDDFAVDVSGRTLKLSREIHGPQHETAVESLNRSAMLFKARSEYARAEPLYLEVLDLLEHQGRKGRKHIGMPITNLAELYRAQGRLALAEAYARRALSVQETVKGSQHMATWLAINNLASILRERGSYHEAVTLHTRALRIVRRRRGYQHRDTSITLNNLGSLFQTLGKKPEAERAHRAALKIREKLLGPDHPMTSTSRNNLALTLKSIKQFDEAEALYRQVLASLERTLPEGHVNIGTCAQNLGVLLLDTGKIDEAAPILARALQIRETRLGPDHKDVAATLNALSQLDWTLGRRADAIDRRERSLKILSRALGAQHRETRRTLERLAKLYDAVGRGDDAQRLRATPKEGAEGSS